MPTRFIAVALAASLAACIVPLNTTNTDGSTGNATSDVASICAKAVSCGLLETNGNPYTQSDCLAQYNGWIPALNCAADYSAASCDDVLGTGSGAASLNSICFPSCATSSGSVCSGVDITECTTSGVSLTFTCAGKCAQQSRTFVGTCGTTYNGTTSPSGESICWCN
ncbi:MAG: hypothetical protein ACHREM_23740 [Polyangiales bacterium]